MHLLYNFQLLPAATFALACNNRAFQYNDGLFDTLIWANGRTRFLADHLARTQQALRVLQIDVPAELQHAELLEKYLHELAAQNYLTHELARVKMHLWRAPGGLFTPEQTTAETLTTIHPQAVYPPVIPRADFAATVRNSYSPLSFFKGPLAAQYVLASLEKKQKQLDELILLDAPGFISEGLTANICWLKENTLYTPTLATGCIAGIARKNLLKICAAESITVAEGFFKPRDLLAAEVVFTSNVTGLRPIRCIGSTEFTTAHPVLQKLTAAFTTV